MNAVSLGRDEAGAFARRLAQRREALGLRKQDLAKKMGLSLTTIQQYERGQWPRGGHAVRLARTLGCSLDWLLAGKGEAEGGVLDTPDARLVMVPMVEARLSAGTGSFETSDEVLRHYAFAPQGQPFAHGAAAGFGRQHAAAHHAQRRGAY